MDAHRSHKLVGGNAQHGESHDRDGVIVDRVAVIAFEDPLFLAEDGTAQRMRLAALPGRGREFHLEFARAIGSKGFEHHLVSILS